MTMTMAAKIISPFHDSLSYSFHASQFGLSLLSCQTEISIHVGGQGGRGLFLCLFKQILPQRNFHFWQHWSFLTRWWWWWLCSNHCHNIKDTVIHGQAKLLQKESHLSRNSIPPWEAALDTFIHKNKIYKIEKMDVLLVPWSVNQICLF